MKEVPRDTSHNLSIKLVVTHNQVILIVVITGPYCMYNMVYNPQTTSHYRLRLAPVFRQQAYSSCTYLHRFTPRTEKRKAVPNLITGSVVFRSGRFIVIKFVILADNFRWFDEEPHRMHIQHLPRVMLPSAVVVYRSIHYRRSRFVGTMSKGCKTKVQIFQSSSGLFLDT